MTQHRKTNSRPQWRPLLLSAVALSSLLVCSQAAAQQRGGSSVQLYGKASMGIDNYKASGSSTPGGNIAATTRVYDAGSYFGLRGTEDLGNGWNAHFLLEGGVSMDTGGNLAANGGVNSSAGTLGSRAAYVGLRSNTLGTLRFGRQSAFWTSPYINQTGSEWVSSGFGVQSGGIGRGMAVGVVRLNDAVQYISPRLFDVGEFILTTSLSPREANVGNSTKAGSIWALTLQGHKGKWGYGLDLARNQANQATNTSRRQSEGAKLRLRYSYSDSGQISLIALQSTVKNVGPGGTLAGVADPTAQRLRQRGIVLGMSQYFGEGNRFHFIAEYMHLNGVKGCRVSSSCDETGANGYIFALRYLLSKRTNLYVNYQQIRNDRQYNLDWSGNSMTMAGGSNPALGLGADPRLIGVGLVHRF